MRKYYSQGINLKLKGEEKMCFLLKPRVRKNAFKTELQKDCTSPVWEGHKLGKRRCFLVLRPRISNIVGASSEVLLDKATFLK